MNFISNKDTTSQSWLKAQMLHSLTRMLHETIVRSLKLEVRSFAKDIPKGEIRNWISCEKINENNLTISLY